MSHEWVPIVGYIFIALGGAYVIYALIGLCQGYLPLKMLEGVSIFFCGIGLVCAYQADIPYKDNMLVFLIRLIPFIPYFASCFCRGGGPGGYGNSM